MAISIKGIIGLNLKKRGIDGPFENSDITFFGVTDVLKNIFYIRKKIDEAVEFIESFKPDIVFSVDSPDFVFEVIKKLKKRKKIHTKFFHFVAPSIWAWRESRGNKINKEQAFLARDFLNSQVKGKSVSIKRITTDRYNRTVGELYINKINIQELIYQKGFAKIYRKYAYQCPWTSKYILD